jgi:AraC-like DNA-binding protein
VPLLSPRLVHDPVLATELRALFDELGRPLIGLDCCDRVIRWLKQLVARYACEEPAISTGAPRYKQGVRRVRDYLRARVSKPVSIDTLARIAGLSKYYLLRQFEREFGMSPHSYQMELRLARARTLLSRGATPSFAAYAAGFADQSHLTRRMKVTDGVTPSAYARQFSISTGKSARSRTGVVGMRGGIETAA